MGKDTQSLKITLIGAGDLATNLGLALSGASHNIVCVYSRTEASASALATRLGCTGTTDLEATLPAARQSDVVIFSLQDRVLAQLAQQMQDLLTGVSKPDTPHHGDSPSPHLQETDMPATTKKNASALGPLFVHTAGSMPMDTLPMDNRGVLYPMQTFSKARQTDFAHIPTFLETAHAGSKPLLENLARSITDRIFWLPSQRRKSLHLAAVFTCNFANYCYDVASELLERDGIPFDVMLPLIQETTAKLQQLSPFDAQTGPAVRNDRNVMLNHLEMLADNPDFQALYRDMSRLIHERHTRK